MSNIHGYELRRQGETHGMLVIGAAAENLSVGAPQESGRLVPVVIDADEDGVTVKDEGLPGLLTGHVELELHDTER